jgi:hypothetical protein
VLNASGYVVARRLATVSSNHGAGRVQHVQQQRGSGPVRRLNHRSQTMVASRAQAKHAPAVQPAITGLERIRRGMTNATLRW